MKTLFLIGLSVVLIFAICAAAPFASASPPAHPHFTVSTAPADVVTPSPVKQTLAENDFIAASTGKTCNVTTRSYSIAKGRSPLRVFTGFMPDPGQS